MTADCGPISDRVQQTAPDRQQPKTSPALLRGCSRLGCRLRCGAAPVPAVLKISGACATLEPSIDLTETDHPHVRTEEQEPAPNEVVMVKALVERKRSRRFANDDRLIGDYKVRDVDGESRLWAEARSPYPKSA